MASVPKAKPQPVRNVSPCFVFGGLEEFEAVKSILRNIDRLNRFASAPSAPLAAARCLLFLNVSCVRQHNRAKINRWRRSKDWSAEPFPHQPGKQAAVVNVSVGQDDCRDLIGGK